MSQPELSVIVLAYNEAENLERVLGDLKEFLADYEPHAEIILVDDGSTDRTYEVAKECLRPDQDQLLQHDRNRGMGAGLKTGVSAARGTWVTFLPADGQIYPQAIYTLRKAARDHDADVVFSVYENRDDGLMRKVLSTGVRSLIWLTHGQRLQSDGPYLFKRSLFIPEQLPSDSFFINFEFPIGALRAGLKTAVVRIPCRPRLAGHSKSARAAVIVRVGRELLSLRARRVRQVAAQYAAR